VSSETKLPELPEATAYCEPHSPFRDDAFSWPGDGRQHYHTDSLYTAAQMQAYARAAVEQATADEGRDVPSLEWLEKQHDSWIESDTEQGFIEYLHNAMKDTTHE
jgi:hypothetical protein